MGFFSKVRSFVWSKHFLKHSAYILLTYIVIVFILIMYLDSYTDHGAKVEVPKIVGMRASNGLQKLEELDLKMEILDSVYDPDLPAGTIVSQDPQATSISTVSVKPGRIIRVQLSKKSRLVEMPGLVDRSERFAQSVLKNRGLKYRITYKPTSEADGAVLKQLFKGAEIEEGTKIPIGSTITLIVGQNDAAQPVELIDLNGLTISEAKARLSAMSLQILVGTCVGCATAADSTSATITSQSPEYLEGTMIAPGTTITVSAEMR
ncbi:MAG TPA: PASTA domain-containing protein [Fluviicola sp.]|nr:PASTA domain-containing protein [Fluviicola sp.]